jgi:chromosome segregation ATPase
MEKLVEELEQLCKFYEFTNLFGTYKLSAYMDDYKEYKESGKTLLEVLSNMVNKLRAHKEQEDRLSQEYKEKEKELEKMGGKLEFKILSKRILESAPPAYSLCASLTLNDKTVKDSINSWDEQALRRKLIDALYRI